MKLIRKLLANIYYKILCRVISTLKLYLYLLLIPYRKRKVRKKETIKVLFIVSEVASWKTELLYLAMIRHNRFQPILGISTSTVPNGAKLPLTIYLNSKGYNYIDLDVEEKSIDRINPDIIFYYKPYTACYSKGHFFNYNKRYLFCGMDYCFSVTKHEAHIDKEYFNYCWLFFTEHVDVAKRRKELLGVKAMNVRVTGVPMQDILLLPKDKFCDPWIDKTQKKRIIYAPHHSIQGTNGEGIEFATFLEYGETMLEFAKKYNETITVAFKPHPNLYMKLIKIWGKERTDNYYHSWESLPNTQVETGEYVGLFKYSDAIIHDCASFIVEYLYMDKPGMYLMAETNDVNDMFDFVCEGFGQYELGRSVGEVERFIKDIINGRDVRKEKRQSYISRQLIPPHGKTACENIMSEIIGE